LATSFHNDSFLLPSLRTAKAVRLRVV
jgi:hypothetical protein